MPPTVITRAGWIDDDGTGTTGTVLNNARLQNDVYAKVDQMLGGGPGYDSLVVGKGIGHVGVGTVSAPAVAPAGEIRQYFNSGSRLQLTSRDGGPYQPVTLIDGLLAAMCGGFPFVGTIGDFKSVDGIIGLTTVPTAYTVPGAGVAVAVITKISVFSVHSANVEIAVCLTPNGGGVGTPENTVREIIPPGVSIDIPGPFFMDPSDTLRFYAAVDSVTSIRAEVVELAAQPARCTLKVIDGVNPTPSTTPAAYTVPGAGVTKAMMVHAAVANLNGAANQVYLYAGTTATLATAFCGVLLPPAASFQNTGPVILDPGDSVYSWRTLGSAPIRLSIVEFM